MIPAPLRDDLHVHLYGCLTAAAVHSLGRAVWQERRDRLAWYEAEYEKAWGRRPDAAAYWTALDGEARLARDFELVAAAPFARFQACFNLLIALFPIVPGDTRILAHVLTAQRAEGIRYGEYRCFVPPHLRPDEVFATVAGLAEHAAAVAAESAGAFLPRLAFSLCRDPRIGAAHHQALRAVLAERPALAAVVTGLDFCGVEEEHPPQLLAPLLAAIHAANAAAPDRALAVLYHVGESFGDKSLASAVRWVHTAHVLGAHRLGHATSLGMDPEGLEATAPARSERVSERRDHLAWLSAEAGWLGRRGYPVDQDEVRRELATLAPLAATDRVPVRLDAAARAEARRLQDAVLAELAAGGAVIESCPTSNLRIGRIADPAHHPLPRFLAAGVTTVVASDDPGLFATTLAGEAEVCRLSLGLAEPALARLAAATTAARSERLVRRRA